MDISIIGGGYVGLVTAACLSNNGHKVICVERSKEKIKKLSTGKTPIFEPGLEELIKLNLGSGKLSFTTDLSYAVKNSEAVFIAVGTPMIEESEGVDLKDICNVFKELAYILKNNTLVIVKSTVPVGTNRMLRDLVRGMNPTLNFDIVSNPEFLRQGSAIKDFENPDRIIIGSETKASREIMESVYRTEKISKVPILHTGLESAELIKYAANAFLATKVSFINEIAALCEKIGADVNIVSKGLGLDERIGARFLDAGPGYGGSCFPKDAAALVHLGKEKKVPQRVTEAGIAANNATKQRMIINIINLCNGCVEDKTILVLGVTFKADTGDMREAPSLTIIPALMENGANIRIVDPVGQQEGSSLFPDAKWYDDVYMAAKNIDCMIVLTDWQDFKELDLYRIASNMRKKCIGDLRNIFPRETLKKVGFESIFQVGKK
jgi:UDPglucose 6-dehydrogenase